MIMDVVVPFQNSVNADEELRYALRSLEHVHEKIDNVWIVGDKPRWDIKNIIFLPFGQSMAWMHRDRNIAEKLLFACSLDAVADDILILHDDNFILPSFDPRKYYHQGQRWNGTGTYAHLEENTKQLLGQQINNYDLHGPHVMNKKRLKLALDSADWKVPYGYGIKTLYGARNYGRLDLEMIDDCKLGRDTYMPYYIEVMIKDRPFFSVSDLAFRNQTRKSIELLYPNPSHYE